MNNSAKNFKVNYDYIDLNKTRIESNVLKLIPKDIMDKYCLIPIENNDNIISVAMSNPNDRSALQDIKFLTKKDVKVFTASKEQISSILDSVNEKERTDIILEQIKKEYRENYNKLNNNNSYLYLGNSPIIKFTDSIINSAIRRRASDIHIEPFEDTVNIRFRIDGILYMYRNMPKDIYCAVCTRIKIQSHMNIAEKRLPQDGKIDFAYKSYSYDLRVSTLPTLYGEKIVIRILYKEDTILTLKSLGFSDKGIKYIDKALKNSHGIILVTGPTGSGKTTSLYAMLNEMDKNDKNIITIENPVEYTMENVNQVNVNAKAGLTFASGLKSILRQDPNVIMIGEIRDEETAQIAIRAAITGHLVISTLHTNDAASSLLRLIDMGVPNYLVSDSLILCISQRLVRKICSYCKIEYSPTVKEKSDLNLEENTVLYKGRGCHFCNNTGYKYRTAVYEIMHMDDNIRAVISKGEDVDKIRKYYKQIGMKNIKDYCRDLVLEGITTYEEYIRLCSSCFY